MERKTTMEPELVVIDGVLPKDDFYTVLNEVEAHRDEMKSDSEYATYQRYYPEPMSILSELFDKAIFNKQVFDIAKQYHDLSWKWYCGLVSDRYEVQVTSYKKERKDKYDWHVDHLGFEHRTLNCILYLNDIQKGGELQIADDFGVVGEIDFNKDYKVLNSFKPKANRLAIMPSWYIHRVTPLENDNEERLTLNGHVVMNEEGIISTKLWNIN